MRRGEFYNAEGDKLLKVYLDNPLDVYRFRRNFTRTYEADVPIEDRYLIDNYQELPEYEMRKLFIDLEALQFRQETDQKMRFVLMILGIIKK